MYSFDTEILGVTAEIEGVFDPGEKESLNCPGEPPSFSIEAITINDEEFEIDTLNTETLEAISDEAFDKAADDMNEYHSERVNCE